MSTDTAIRSVRTEMNVPGATMVQLALVNPSQNTFELARTWDSALNRMARVSGTINVSTPPTGSVQLVVRGEVFALPLFGIIDVAAEKARLEKEMSKVDADIKRVDAKLGNPDFV